MRAFHNICRHRGAQLLRAAGKTREVIVCPYHDWTYDLEGKLRVIPDRRRAFAGVDLDGLDLKPAAFARWRGMLWVHPSADDAPVADWFAAIEPHLGQHRVDRLPEEPDARSERVIAANWKIDAAALSRYIHNHSQSHKSLKSQFRQSTHPHSKKIPPTDNERPPSILKILINP
ncbi:MAG: Rieske (2Fe-2S) protein, partial [Caldilineaceae bacterium]|nr:Rieske (2Fe-2S) protein [Caldilineaceae bacterium]